MANFHNLEHDIKEMLQGRVAPESLELRHDTAHGIVRLAKNVATHTLEMVNHRAVTPKDPSVKTVRMSEVGEPCVRKLVYKWYKPEFGLYPYAEYPNPYLPVKFTFGDYIEELTLFLAQEAGHDVRARQKEVTLKTGLSDWYAIGHMDAIISDVVVDVKSAADGSFKKYQREGLTNDNDNFGYRWQLDAYALAEGTTARAFVFTNKHDGEIHVINRTLEPLLDVEARIHYIGQQVDKYNHWGVMPERLPTVPTAHGEKLGTVCGYCSFKWACYDGDIAGVIKSGRPLYFKKSALTPEGKKLVLTSPPIPTPENYQVPF